MLNMVKLVKLVSLLMKRFSKRTPENIEAVTESVHDNPSPLTRRRSQEFNISRPNLCWILRKILVRLLTKVQLVQELKPHDQPLHFRTIILIMPQKQKKRFSDEGRFRVISKGTLISKIAQNQTWSYSQCTYYKWLSGGILGPYFLKNKDGLTNTVNGDTTDFLVPALHGINVNDVWFQ